MNLGMFSIIFSSMSLLLPIISTIYNQVSKRKKREKTALKILEQLHAQQKTSKDTTRVESGKLDLDEEEIEKIQLKLKEVMDMLAEIESLPESTPEASESTQNISKAELLNKASVLLEKSIVPQINSIIE